MGVQDRLKKMRESYDQDRKGDVTWDAVPGTYNGIVTEATMFESKKGALYLKVQFAIDGGDHHGHRYDFIGGLDKDTQRRMNFQALRNMGCSLPSDVMDLEDAIAAFGDRHPKIRFSLVKRGEYLNLNIRTLKVLALDTDPDEIPDVPDEEEEEGVSTHIPQEDDDDDDGEDLKVGSFVEVVDKGEGTVTEINEDAGLAEVELSATGEREWFGGDVLSMIDKLTVKRSTTKKGE